MKRYVLFIAVISSLLGNATSIERVYTNNVLYTNLKRRCSFSDSKDWWAPLYSPTTTDMQKKQPEEFSKLSYDRFGVPDHALLFTNEYLVVHSQETAYLKGYAPGCWIMGGLRVTSGIDSLYKPEEELGTRSTISFWINIPSYKAVRSFMAICIASDDDGGKGYFNINGSGQIEYWQYSRDNSKLVSDPLPIGKWVMVTVTFNNGDADLYINGEHADSGRVGAYNYDYTQTTHWRMTAIKDLQIDDLEHFTTCMSASEVKDLYDIERAVESEITYTNLKGATHTNPSTYIEGGSVSFTVPTSEVIGYQFDGWTPSTITDKMTGDQIVRANWQPITYSIAFHGNGATGEMNAMQMTYDEEKSITSNTFVRTGYVFDGWSTSSDGLVEYHDGSMVSNMTKVLDQEVSLYAVWVPLVVQPPTISPQDGTTFSTDSCIVTLNCSMEGAAIYYTTNGTTPKVDIAYLYTQPFAINGTVNVKTMAVKDTVKSVYATATITKVDPIPVDTPVISPEHGSTFSTETCEVTINCPTDGATIYYSTDGKTPKTTESYRYDGPFSISGTTTIKAVATKDGWLKSAYTTATITKVSLTLESALGADLSVTVTTGGTANWTPVSDATAKNGGTSVRSGLSHTDDNSESWIQLAVNGRGTLSFWCKTSCEHDDDNTYSWDHVEVSVDGVPESAWRMDGKTQWIPRSVTFDTDDEHKVKIVYIKDSSAYDGDDCAWIDGVVWTPSATPVDPIPDIGDTPSAADVEAAVAGAADPQVKAKIDATNYNDFRNWAGRVKTKGGSNAGSQGVMDADTAWFSYALGQDTLLEDAPTDADLTVQTFEPASEVGKFDFTVSVGTIQVGSTAAKENLKKVFGLEGASTLDPTAFSSEKVDIEFGTPVNGKVKFTAGPNSENANSKAFFMKVKMLP